MTSATFNAILQLKQHWDSEISSWKPRAAPGPKLFTHLFTHPWVNAAQVSQVCAISSGSAYSLIERFVACGIHTSIQHPSIAIDAEAGFRHADLAGSGVIPTAK